MGERASESSRQAVLSVQCSWSRSSLKRRWGGLGVSRGFFILFYFVLFLVSGSHPAASGVPPGRPGDPTGCGDSNARRPERSRKKPAGQVEGAGPSPRWAGLCK